MKRKFNYAFILLWLIITGTLWMLDDTQGQRTMTKIGSMLSELGVLAVTTYFMSAVILPKFIGRKQLILFFCGFMSIFQGIILWLIDEVFYLVSKDTFLESGNERESFLVAILVFFPVNIFLNLGFCGLKIYFEHTELRSRHLELQKVYLESQLQMLQNQINPHFMFNVLNHILMLIQKNPDLATSLLIKYSEILRYQLYSTKLESVNLAQELEFINNYIDVEKYRWKYTLDINFRMQIENGNQAISPLLFTPFIENAFKYVFTSKEKKGYIDIGIEQQDNRISMEIENSRSVVKTKNGSSGLGLENVKKRLEILYGDDYILTTKETDNTYYVKLILKKE
jgi:sensor histidine kinase YesM